MANVAKRSWNQKTIIQKLIKQRANEQASEASSRARFTLISHMILFINDEVTIIIEHESSAQN